MTDRAAAGVAFDLRGLRETPRAADVDAVRALVLAVGVFSPLEVAIAVEVVDAALQGGPASGYRFLFAERQGELAGYTCFGPVPATRGSFDLYWIAVAPRARGQGLGRQLLAHTEARIAAAAGQRIFVDTSSRPDYAPAHRLYAGAGYAEAARLPDFYGPGDAKLIFAKWKLGAPAGPVA